MKTPPIPGKMVDVGGYRLHVQSRGKGRPAAVLISGLGCTHGNLPVMRPDAVAKAVTG